MTEPIGLRRMHRTLLIHRVVQVLLLLLLLYMALLFQQKFEQKYASLQPFYTSVGLTLLLQAVFFFPIRKFAESEARREVTAAGKARLTDEEQKQLRSQRLFADFLKASAFIFFVAFILMLKEQATVFQGTAYFSCIAAVLSYLQSFNYAVRGLLAKKSARQK
jgi:hypothetical protein